MKAEREQVLGSLLFAVLLCCGWTPFLLVTAKSGMYDAPVILAGGIFAILAAGMTYDAAERLLGKGKGVYAAAIFASFTPAAIVLSEPPLLTSTCLMFVTAAALWFSARATLESYREHLFFISALGGISLAVFGAWPPALLPLVTLIILFERAKAPVIALFAALLLPAGGLIFKSAGILPLPEFAGSLPKIATSTLESVLLPLPWLPWLLLLVLWPKRLTAERWPRFVLLTVALLFVLTLVLNSTWPVILGAAAPLCVLCVAALVARWFEAHSENKMKALRWLALFTAAGLLVLLYARIVRWPELILLRNHALLAMIAAVLLVVSIVRDARRVLFGVSVVAAWIIAALWWRYANVESFDDLPKEFDLAVWIAVTAGLFQAVIRRLYGRRIPQRLRQAGEKFRFDSARFRRFDKAQGREWEAEAVDVTPANTDALRLAIFGDVAGSEFPFSSRESGYYAFRTIVEEINQRNPDAVVSTGDLAARATHLAFRRLRVLLKRAKFPLLATPGNHDIVERGVVQPQFFHALFGADHADVTLGPVRMILLNNAWGSLADEQWTWIEKTFAQPSSAAHTLVFCHKPVIDPRGDQYYGMEWRPHAERLMELFAVHRVTAVFSGHIHSLLHAEYGGVHYIISGGGGSKLKTEADAHHYLWCEATRELLTILAFEPGNRDPLLKLELARRS